MLGLWPIDTLKNRAFIDFVHPECKDLIRADLKDLAEEKLRMPLKLTRPYSMPVEVEIAAIPYAASTTKKSDAMMVIARDVTERNRALAAVEHREENLRIVMDTVADGIIAVDANGNIEMANAAIEGMFGTSPQTLIDKHISVLLPDFKGAESKNFNDITSKENNESKLSGVPELLGNRADGTTLPVEVVFNETTSAGRKRYIGAIRDVTARKTYEDRLRTMATRDALTDLANRNLLDERLGDAIRILNHFKSMGISISMDDFGTGYCSLSYLTRFPLDSLKVDRAFATNLPDDRDALVVVRAIVGMAKELNLNIVAEGIET